MPTAPETDRRRALVLGVALAVLLVKLGVAATTFGTNDIRHWQDFVAGVAAHGPVGVYGVDFASSFYNHPPLIGYLLEFVGLAARHGVSVGFTLRALASLSDVASALLVFEILRRRQSARQAASGAAVFAASPVLFVISGFHGNTDPIFLMLVLLSLHLLADRRRPASAGAAVALALGVKIVPIVVVPVLLVYALTRGARTAVAFGAGFSTAFAITWLPALVGQARAVRADVLGYRGSGISQWGWVQLGHWLGDPAWAEFLARPGRFLVLGLAAGVPAALVWRSPPHVAQAVGIALAGFLFLSPAFGTQYLVWGLALYLISWRWASVYSVAAGLLLGWIYTDWAGGVPWDEADWHSFTRPEVIGALAVWLVLGAAVAAGLRRAWTGPGAAEGAAGGAGGRPIGSSPPTPARTTPAGAPGRRWSISRRSGPSREPAV